MRRRVRNANPTHCPSLLTFDAGGPIRALVSIIQCSKDPGHDGLHFASWGGSQRWRLAHWDDEGVQRRPGGVLP